MVAARSKKKSGRGADAQSGASTSSAAAEEPSGSSQNIFSGIQAPAYTGTAQAHTSPRQQKWKNMCRVLVDMKEAVRETVGGDDDDDYEKLEV